MLISSEDNSMVRDWLALNNVATRSQFDKLMTQAVQRERISGQLGFVPTSAQDLVGRYVEKNAIKLSANDQIIRQRTVRYGDAVIQAHDVEHCDCPHDVRLAYKLANATPQNLDEFELELRLLRDQLNLLYSDTSIRDAVTAWAMKARQQAKIGMFMQVAFAKGKGTGPVGLAMWEAMERACFDIRETRPGFAIEVVRKFMWQAKRKAVGLPVTNHLMPVLTGPQGKGKSTFVQALCAPLAELKRDVNFTQICDERIIDIWSSHILFIDEMSNFTKSDADVIKNVITAPVLTRRPMRSNATVQVQQQATFIGCTNKSLAQLIRDDTGGRRFAELVWRSDPDWEAMNALDWHMLWTSVDENAPDPISQETARALKEQQEDNRNQHPVEVWGRQVRANGSWTTAVELYASYREWEREAFPRFDTNQAMFGRTLTTLITNMDDFPWSKARKADGVRYRKD